MRDIGEKNEVEKGEERVEVMWGMSDRLCDYWEYGVVRVGLIILLI